MKQYSVVIPTYNEADKISSTLTQISVFMHTFAESYEIIVVDDGSRDATTKVIEDYIADKPDIILIKNPHKGKGAALWTGVMRAQGEYVYLCDADLSTPINEIKKLAIWIQEHDYDIVIASREGLGARRVNEPLYRHILGRGFNFFVRLILLPGIMDTQCGFKLFKGDAAKKVFSKLKVYGQEALELKDPYLGAFDVEVLYIALHLGYRIKIVPVVWKYVKTTRLRPIADSVKMAIDVLKIKFNALKNVY